MDTFMTKMLKINSKFIGKKFIISSLCLIVTIVASNIFLVSCTIHDTDIISRTIIEYEIPFIESASKWNSISQIETDDFGRILYSIAATGDSFNNVFSDYTKDDLNNSPVFAYFICQKLDGDTVYCYEDVCYVYVPTFDEAENIINILKDDNDWDKLLNEEKMTALPKTLEILSDYSIDYEEKAVSALEKELDRDFQGFYIDDVYSSSNNRYFVIREVEIWINDNGGESNDFGDNYIFTYNELDNEVVYEKLDDDIDLWRDQIFQFKTANIDNDFSH